MNEPGRPLRVLETGPGATDRLETATMASCCPMIRLWSSDSMVTSRAVSSSVRRWTGMPVHCASTSAISSSSMTPADFLAGHRAQLAFLLGPFGDQGPLLVAQLGGPLVLLGLHRLGLVAAQLTEPLVDLLEVGEVGQRLIRMRDPRLVDEVDRLVGEVTVGDVAVGQVGGADQGGLGEPHLVVHLVAVLEPLEDLDGLADRRAPRPGPAGSGAPAPSPSPGTCGTPPGWWRRWSAARPGPASA